MKFKKKEIDNFFRGIYDGTISENNLSEPLYNAISKDFKKALYDGFGKTLKNVSRSDRKLLIALRDNVHIFSAAKTYQQTKEMSSLRIDQNGKLRPYKDFEELAKPVFNTFNGIWQAAEKQTTLGQGQMAAKWLSIKADKSFLPYLKYSAVGDACDTCGPLDGLVALVSDKIWKTKSPLNHVNCRCLIIQLDAVEGKAELTPTDRKNSIDKEVDDKMDPVFKMNPAFDKVIWSNKHPYFDIDAKDKAFAKKNFGLPIPEKD